VRLEYITSNYYKIMKKLLFTAMLALIGITLFSSNQCLQNTKLGLFCVEKYTKDQIEVFVREVFKDKADELVLKSNTRRLEIITDFLNRVEIYENANLGSKKIELLSSIPINRKYNPDLKLDTYYNQNTFNPLKYDFNMSSSEILIYRIDNTNYIIRIFPIK